MKKFFWPIIILCIVALTTLDLKTEYFKVLKSKIGKKAQKNINCGTLEHTQSFIITNRISTTKDYEEWLDADSSSKKALENLAAHKYANFDEQKYLLNGPVKNWLYCCKNGISPLSSTMETPIREKDEGLVSPF